MRILQVIRPGTGGAAKHLLMLLRAIDRTAFETVVAASPLEDPTYPDIISRMGFEVHLLPQGRSPSLAADPAALRQLVRLIRNGAFDLVHAHTAKSGFLGRLGGRLAGGPPVLYTPHGYYFLYDDISPSSRWIYYWAERCLSPFTDRVICVSREEERQVRESRVIPARKIALLPNGLEFERYQGPFDRPAIRKSLELAPEHQIIGMVGRMMPPKDPLTLLAAFRQLAPRYPRARLVLVGDGTLLPACRQRVRESGLAPRVHFVTDRPHDATEVNAIFDVEVLSSNYEGLPYALLEGMALRLPIVATDIAGCRDLVVPGETGLLFPPRQPEILAAHLARLLEDPGFASELARRGEALVRERYGIAGWISGLQDLYRSVRESRPATTGGRP